DGMDTRCLWGRYLGVVGIGTRGTGRVARKVAPRYSLGLRATRPAPSTFGVVVGAASAAIVDWRQHPTIQIAAEAAPTRSRGRRRRPSGRPITKRVSGSD